jgi:hypothetical protein
MYAGTYSASMRPIIAHLLEPVTLSLYPGRSFPSLEVSYTITPLF